MGAIHVFTNTFVMGYVRKWTTISINIPLTLLNTKTLYLRFVELKDDYIQKEHSPFHCFIYRYQYPTFNLICVITSHTYIRQVGL